jgi:hypothetical protein
MSSLLQSLYLVRNPDCRYLQLNLKDRKRGDKRDYVSLMLELSKTSDLKSEIVVEASFKLLIYDQAYGKHREHECTIANTKYMLI